ATDCVVTYATLCFSHSLSLFFFFLLLRPLPTSPLFPTRRSSDLDFTLFLSGLGAFNGSGVLLSPGLRAQLADFATAEGVPLMVRSEEHTSELQSPYDIVCRLLLEKKNNYHPTASSPLMLLLPLYI